MRGFFSMALTLILVVGAAACGGTSSPTVTDAWARVGNSGGNGAVYFQIANSTGQDDTLMSARADIAQAAELHMSSLKDDGTMTMEHQDGVPVPQGQRVEFKPGGMHVMLVNLKQDLKVGDKFPLTLLFHNGGEVKLDVEVKEP